jgi:alkanesulfonate monooxygenase SsuD/methylene tetrahydromethanopterin reductase-like flavin-dependent oxidoreductase (luciferase family)
LRYALFIPIFNDLADPRAVADLAVRAETAGWDGVFVWDHMLYRPPVEAVADPWVTMAAIAAVTERVRIGPMVTPVARRRPQKLARECISLDQLSLGRLVLGVGLGGDPGGELTKFGEELDAVKRAERLDDGLALLDAWWQGREANGATVLPRPVQQPRIPVWVASVFPHRAPLRRAARWDGWFPIGLPDPAALVEQHEFVHSQRAEMDAPYDIAIQGLPDTDPSPWSDAGATWWLVRFDPFTVTADMANAIADAGPPRL